MRLLNHRLISTMLSGVSGHLFLLSSFPSSLFHLVCLFSVQSYGLEKYHAMCHTKEGSDLMLNAIYFGQP